jgi:glycosyltransferase involved in cell wall biosynthesis
MPAYNSAKHVRESIDALLAQVYPSIELIISDDGSTDGTREICEEVARADPRVTVIGGAHLGERHNFNVVLARATGEYFMWAADHDLWDPSYVSACVSALEADPGAVLAYARSRWIDESGSIGDSLDDQLQLESDRASERYRRLIWNLAWGNAIYGVVRRRDLQRTGGYTDHPTPDHLVLAKLAMSGRFLQIPRILYFRRANRLMETPDQQLRRQAADLDPTDPPTWSQPPADYFRGLRDAHIRAVLGARWGPVETANAAFATLYCFNVRFGVGAPFLRVLGIRRWFRGLMDAAGRAFSSRFPVERRGSASSRPEFTGERVVLARTDRWWRDSRAVEHVVRYQFASRLLRPSMRVIDIATGTGYGASVLASMGCEVTGYDIDGDSIAFARNEWPEVHFEVADATALPEGDRSIDVVVSFETIEHLADPSVFVSEIARVLRPGGFLVLSTPNRPVFAKRSSSPFHVSEMDHDELSECLDPWFTVEWFGQTQLQSGRLRELSDGLMSLPRLVSPILAVRPFRVEQLRDDGSVFFVVVARPRNADAFSDH